MKPEKLIQLKPEEEILKVVYEAILPNLPKFLLFVLILALPFFFLFPLFRAGSFGVAVFFIILIVGVILTIRAFFKWSRTILIITDKRVIDLDQFGLFSRVVSEARFHQIDEVTFKIKGVLPTLFRYGVLNMHLSGSAADIEYKHVVKPALVVDLINDLREEQ